jgi:MEMO1 family protein
MRVRKRFLPPGWYPAGPQETREAILAMQAEIPAGAATALAGVAPHAGWEFSGAMALAVFSRLSRSVDTIVIIGGHLGPSDGLLAAFEDGFETPEGPIRADTDLLDGLRSRLPIREDRFADNTVEVQLPFVKRLFPGAMALGLRAPPNGEAASLGEALAAISRDMGRRIAAVGSTDLTHYGPNYGFCPAGKGRAALSWVRDTNDRRFIESLLMMDSSAAIGRSVSERSACSAGGAVAAMCFARARGAHRGTLVEYATSWDVHPAESFVGYAAILYEPGINPEHPAQG